MLEKPVVLVSKKKRKEGGWTCTSQIVLNFEHAFHLNRTYVCTYFSIQSSVSISNKHARWILRRVAAFYCSSNARYRFRLCFPVGVKLSPCRGVYCRRSTTRSVPTRLANECCLGLLCLCLTKFTRIMWIIWTFSIVRSTFYRVDWRSHRDLSLSNYQVFFLRNESSATSLEGDPRRGWPRSEFFLLEETKMKL